MFTPARTRSLLVELLPCGDLPSGTISNHINLRIPFRVTGLTDFIGNFLWDFAPHSKVFNCRLNLFVRAVFNHVPLYAPLFLTVLKRGWDKGEFFVCEVAENISVFVKSASDLIAAIGLHFIIRSPFRFAMIVCALLVVGRCGGDRCGECECDDRNCSFHSINPYSQNGVGRIIPFNGWLSTQFSLIPEHANRGQCCPERHTVRGVVVRLVCPFTSLLGAGRGSYGSAPRLLSGGVS